jgi:hypothetical protein
MLNAPYSIKEKGITLVEIVIAIFIVVLFTMILISDFPRIQRQYALSSVTYKLAQDLRKIEDLGLSGVQVKDKYGNVIATKGYGIYVDFTNNTNQNHFARQYIIYADVNGDQTYNYNQSCDLAGRDIKQDCAIETIDISKQSSSLYMSRIENSDGTTMVGSIIINFTPPGPKVYITDGDGKLYPHNTIGIVLENTDGLARKVWVNTSGLINVD